MSRVSTRTLVADQPFTVETLYDDSAIPARFASLEDGDEHAWTIIEWPGATHTVQLANGEYASVEELTEEDEGW